MVDIETILNSAGLRGLWDSIFPNGSSQSTKWAMLAESCAQRGQFLQAVLHITEAIMIDPDNALLWNSRGIYRSDLGLVEDAIDDFSTALRLKEMSPFYANRGQQHYRLRELDLALEDATKSLELDPEVSDLWVNRALAHYEMHNDELVIKDCDRALELNPNNPYALNQRALSRVILERYEDAEDDANRAIELLPGFSEGYVTLANVHLCMNELDRALQDCDTVVRLSNDSIPEVYHVRGKAVFGRGGWHECIKDYNRCLRDLPSYTEATYDLANAYMAIGKYDECIEAFKSIMPEKHTEKYLVNAALCCAHLCIDDVKEAERHIKESCEQIMEKEGKIPAYLRRCRAATYLAQNKFNEALEEMDVAVEISEKNAAQYVMRCLVYIRIGNLDKALSDGNKALSTRSTNVHIWECDAAAFLVRGYVFAELGDMEQMETDFKKALKMAKYMKRSLREASIWRTLFGDEMMDIIISETESIEVEEVASEPTVVEDEHEDRTAEDQP